MQVVKITVNSLLAPFFEAMGRCFVAKNHREQIHTARYAEPCIVQEPVVNGDCKTKAMNGVNNCV